MKRTTHPLTRPAQPKFAPDAARQDTQSPPTRRHFLAGAGASLVLPATQGHAFVQFAPFAFTILRFGLSALARGYVRRGAITSLALSATGVRSAVAATAPRVSAAANLTRIARRAPRKFSRLRAEQGAYAKRESRAFAGVNLWEARRAAQFADLALDGYEAYENVKTITSSDVLQKIGDQRDDLLETMAGYFVQLDKDDSSAVKSFWLDAPSSSSAFRAIDARWRSSYYIEEMDVWQRNDAYAEVYLGVWGKNNLDPWQHYDTVFELAKTEFGWLITRQRSA